MSDKKILIALLLSTFWPAGIHRFYVGKKSQGIITIVMSLTIIGLIPVIIWAFVDFIRMITGNYTDSNGQPLKDWT